MIFIFVLSFMVLCKDDYSFLGRLENGNFFSNVEIICADALHLVLFSHGGRIYVGFLVSETVDLFKNLSFLVKMESLLRPSAS